MTNQRRRQYRIRNWRDYNKALVRRGSLTLRVEEGVVSRRRDTAAPVRRGREVGRDAWKKEAGYHRRSLAETAMMLLRTIFSDRLKAREWRRQETELRVRCAAMNRMTDLGMPQSYAV